MNKEQAEIYIKNSLEMQKRQKDVSKGVQFKFLLVNLACFGIAIALYHDIIFIIFSSVVMALNIFFTIIYAIKKKNHINTTVLLIIQLIVFCITLNFIIFGLYKFTNRFVLWEFLFSIIVQMFAFYVSFFIVKKYFDNYYAKERSLKGKIASGATAGFSYSLALILCRIFAPSLQVGVIILAVIINLLVCLISFAIMAAFYRLYIIKKYKLQFEN